MNKEKIKYYIRISSFAVRYCLKEPFAESPDVAKIILNFRTWQYLCILVVLHSIWIHNNLRIKIGIAGAILFYFANEIKSGHWREEWKKKYVYKTESVKN